MIEKEEYDHNNKQHLQGYDYTQIDLLLYIMKIEEEEQLISK